MHCSVFGFSGSMSHLECRLAKAAILHSKMSYAISVKLVTSRNHEQVPDNLTGPNAKLALTMPNLTVITRYIV